ncbi:hypothetical protein [Fibrobacter sp. UWEL]|uniref:hypothetical protein n=1 Tax=Fibrobacter sp. UWEL TaxID=1896209 RepID=UPI0009151A5A|nr:hypothetical protein [Fibrobacter sp. UWEL]SHL01074.1 hypothetical protein SAMN05720468_11171 [Fibrobacter sp. UWEL]
MATSSITHNFVIDNPESVKRFVDSLDAAEKFAGQPLQPLNGRILTEQDDILAFAARIKSNAK